MQRDKNIEKVIEVLEWINEYPGYWDIICNTKYVIPADEPETPGEIGEQTVKSEGSSHKYEKENYYDIDGVMFENAIKAAENNGFYELLVVLMETHDKSEYEEYITVSQLMRVNEENERLMNLIKWKNSHPKYWNIICNSMAEGEKYKHTEMIDALRSVDSHCFFELILVFMTIHETEENIRYAKDAMLLQMIRNDMSEQDQEFFTKQFIQELE